jgi:hypothetical protein
MRRIPTIHERRSHELLKIGTALDGFGLVFAITLFFCLIQSALDGIANRNRAYDKDRWWYPIYRLVEPSIANRG